MVGTQPCWLLKKGDRNCHIANRHVVAAIRATTAIPINSALALSITASISSAVFGAKHHSTTASYIEKGRPTNTSCRSLNLPTRW